MNFEYAQTIVQLLQQAERHHLPLKPITHAYELVQKYFTCLIRPSGGLFIEHLVRTASILMHHRQSLEVVIAGLLHAIYKHGGKKITIHNEIEKPVHDLLMGYFYFKWNYLTIPKIANSIHSLNGEEKKIVVMRLANELEDYLDQGVCYEFNAVPRLMRIKQISPYYIRIANSLGLPNLAEELNTAFNNKKDVPENLRWKYDQCIKMAPKSYAKIRL